MWRTSESSDLCSFVLKADVCTKIHGRCKNTAQSLSEFLHDLPGTIFVVVYTHCLANCFEYIIYACCALIIRLFSNGEKL